MQELLKGVGIMKKIIEALVSVFIALVSLSMGIGDTEVEAQALCLPKNLIHLY